MGEYLLVFRVVVGGRGQDLVVIETFLTQPVLSHILGISSEHDIRSSSCHVGRDGHGSELSRLSYDESFLLVVLRVEHVVPDTASLQQFAKPLGLIYADGAHQNGLSLGVAFDYLFDDRSVFGIDVFVHDVVPVFSDDRGIGGYRNDVQIVDLLELVLLRHGRTGHAGQFFIHAEIVLESDGGKGPVFSRDVDPFFGLYSLMQTVAVSSAYHQTSRELVHDYDFAVFDDVVDVPLHYSVGSYGLIYMVSQSHVLRIREVGDAEMSLCLFDASLGEGTAAGLLIDDVTGSG